MVSMALKKHYSEKQVIKNKSDYQIFIQHGIVKLNKEGYHTEVVLGHEWLM